MMMPTDDGRERGGGMKKAAAWALCVLWMMVIFMMSEMSGDVSGANAKYFAYSGILIAITALITPYRLYYGIMASVLIIFALISSLRAAQE